MIHKQQQLPTLTNGSADRMPMNSPPNRTGCIYSHRTPGVGWQILTTDSRSPLVVVLASEMGDQFLAHHVAQRVLQLHQLDEQVVLRIDLRGMHRRLVVE